MLLISLVVSFGLVALLYLLAILPMREQIRSLTTSVTQNRIRSASPTPMSYPVPIATTGFADLDDIPEEAFYGDEEPDYKTTPEEVEDAIAERTFNTYNNGQTTSKQQLGSLKM